MSPSEHRFHRQLEFTVLPQALFSTADGTVSPGDRVQLTLCIPVEPPKKPACLFVLRIQGQSAHWERRGWLNARTLKEFLEVVDDPDKEIFIPVFDEPLGGGLCIDLRKDGSTHTVYATTLSLRLVPSSMVETAQEEDRLRQTRQQLRELPKEALSQLGAGIVPSTPNLSPAF